MKAYDKWYGLRLDVARYCQQNNISESDFRFLGIYEPAVVWLIMNDAIEPVDYYITNKKFDWLITENHHDVVQFIGRGLDADIIKAVCTK